MSQRQYVGCTHGKDRTPDHGNGKRRVSREAAGNAERSSGGRHRQN
ncbi:hypothetical protein R3I93_019888 [Phoxinus phoxinus]|uniref:Uncharacterized protein n=1 Tax=Phoxinus phoxinus TaxID=58324 RepID=A0AAN9CCF5_9TELE